MERVENRGCFVPPYSVEEGQTYTDTHTDPLSLHYLYLDSGIKGRYTDDRHREYKVIHKHSLILSKYGK
jgi:hypothetical protein